MTAGISVLTKEGLKTIENIQVGEHLLAEDVESNDIIEYNLFEEFSVDVISFLHEDTLNMFLDEGMIDNDILEKKYKIKKCLFTIRENSRLI